jgi:glycosyltransferase involved in cell wall biosynthesis
VQSGEANHAFWLAQHLSRVGLEVHILTSQIEGIQAIDGMTIHAVMRSWSWLEQWKFVRVARKLSPDVILLVFLGSMYGHHPMMTFAATAVRAVLPSTRFVTQFEHLWMSGRDLCWGTRLLQKLMTVWARQTGTDSAYGTLLRDSDAVIVLSEMHLARLTERYPSLKDKASLIPPPPIVKVCQDMAALREETRRSIGVEEEECLLVYYGYIYSGKGFDTLLRALRILVDRRIPTRLLVVGGPYANVNSPGETARSNEYFTKSEQLATDLGIWERVIWAGPVAADSDETSTLLYAADACVLPFDGGLHLNNSSFAVAAVHCLPVISTRSPTTESVFLDHENVMLCSPGRPNDLASAIEEVATNSGLRDFLAVGVQQLANDWFSSEIVLQRTLETLNLVSQVDENCRGYECAPCVDGRSERFRP